ncbi:mitochondrial 37S ribosomal protein uS2m KNAG_0B05380 [Huiozyma naganishii CBS 8797]|uniref:Ribosomal protein S2 n=1 Tax=Huiozyma naganishii (strain ATCC MYA-139 / BCRC 22969 / CBS 8797 / KCTC 17520 / NBRC 10181 / NCYC 3082 / Yp74L-3) TaxID=1071383 RepID=J7S572_HUIN7|nr:hypothetical protein KNAG_0B05380 [Kazachstania naganishii CBS 8797]CCK68971.1 hypothetical protein KNAG_0B05380 [Kazachstania naganishii CBS 8797]
MDERLSPVGQQETQAMHMHRLKQYNEEMLKKLRRFRDVPAEEASKLENMLKSPLTVKEKQLDEQLTEFFNEFTHLGKQSSSSAAKDTENHTLNISQQLNKYPFLEPSANDDPYTPQELFLRQTNHAKNSARLGADIKDVYFPYKDVSSPLSIEKITLERLMSAGVHLGQSTSLWRSSTQPYIYGTYKGIHIIDLNQTLSHLKRAANVIEGVVENGGIVLFLGTRDGQKRALEEAAKKTNGYFVSSRWIPGTLTNPTEISGLWDKMEVDMLDKPTGRQLTVDEKMCIVKPDLLVVLNPTDNRNALYEAMKTRIPTIGIIDTDSEPSMVTYPIPGNDDSSRSVNLLLGVLARAGQRGLKNRLEKHSPT